MAGKSVLLEIGTEEIPARFIPRALNEIKELAAKKLSEARISHGNMASHATPRRLALIVDELTDMQRDEVREVFGPPKKAAYDKDGNLTKAAIGFARSQGIEPEQLVVKDKEGKGDYISATVEDKGQPTTKVLPAILKDIVLSMHFPKSMRWGDGTIRYARPIHWVLALYGADVVEFDTEGIRSGNRTRGHRFLAPAEIEINSSDEYASKLDAASVRVEVSSRMDAIAKESEALASGVKGKPVYDDELLSILACITEYPVPVIAEYEDKYLDLPDELLTSVMVGHQKYVPVADASGKLINHFIVVSNTVAENAETVRKGALRVIRARFDDAVFYYSDDKDKKLADRLEDLKNVTFQDKLGSMYDKVMRLKDVAAKVAALVAPGAKDDAVRAAELSKSDLISGVVCEFPELQGIMGMYYARNDGEGDRVADAICEQYLPAFSGDSVPATDAGVVVSLSEKLDNLSSFYSIGLKPTGSEDPYALRRQSIGILAILEDKGYDVPVTALLGTVADEGTELMSELSEFFEQRLEPQLAAKGYAHDLVQSVIKRSTLVPVRDLLARLQALKEFKSDPAYNDFLMGIKRVRNIAPEDKPAEVDEGLMTEPAEKALYKQYKAVAGEVSAMALEGQYAKAIEAMKKLTSTINTFFDDVLVMDKDEAVKNNRLSLLKEIDNTASSVADFSRLDERP